MDINVRDLVSVIRKRNPELDEKYVDHYAKELLKNLDDRLVPNLREWMDGKPVTDIWIGKYSVNAVMSIRGDTDFLSALEAMNTYLQDEEAGIALIWRGKR